MLIMKPMYQTEMGSIVQTRISLFSDCFPELLGDENMDKRKVKFFEENKDRSKKDRRLGWKKRRKAKRGRQKLFLDMGTYPSVEE